MALFIMIVAVEIALLLLALLGQLAITVALVNRVHSIAIPDRLRDGIGYCCWATLLLLPSWLFPVRGMTATSLIVSGEWWPLFYFLPLVAIGLYVLILRVYRVVNRPHLHPVLISNHTQKLHLEEVLHQRLTSDQATTVIARFPGNQFLQLHVHEKTIELPRRVPALDGLSIAHVSDLHMNGRLDVAFYRELVRQTNALKPDLIAITGDLFDENQCLGWIPQTLGRLTAPGGVYFILGNHDLRIDCQRARQLLCEAGLIDMGGRHEEITINGRSLILAGNELPWFKPAADMRSCPKTNSQARLGRILLAHTPDQIGWARAEDFDLMLAGHTHGGQICLPIVGPILSPSRMGIRYSAGTFYCDPTVLHVSRGISSLAPLRFNCPPELALLRLQCAKASLQEDEAQGCLELSSAT